MPEIRDLMHAAPVVVPADTPLAVCARHLLEHPNWRNLVAIDQGQVKGLVDDMAVFGLGVMLADGLWFAFEPEGPDVAGTVARSVPLVDGSTSAGIALRQLRGHTALVIVDKGEVVGLLSEHDVMALAPTMLPVDRRVDETASHPVKSVSSTASSRDALQQMGESRIRHLAVVDDGNLVGVVSLRDVVAGWVGPDAQIRDVCTSDPLTILLGTSLRTAASLMAERDVGCLPVVNGTGDLVSILTRSDIVESLATASDDEDLFA